MSQLARGQGDSQAGSVECSDEGYGMGWVGVSSL